MRIRLAHMNIILALCLVALQPAALSGRTVETRVSLSPSRPAHPAHLPRAASDYESESWESHETEGAASPSDERRNNIAELLLPYIERSVSAERHPIHAKKVIHVLPLRSSKERAGDWPPLNSRKKHVVEITPLRTKGRDGKPLAYILSPAKADPRRIHSKHPDSHHHAPHAYRSSDVRHTPRTKDHGTSGSSEERSEENSFVSSEVRTAEEPAALTNDDEDDPRYAYAAPHDSSKKSPLYSSALDGSTEYLTEEAESSEIGERHAPGENSASQLSESDDVTSKVASSADSKSYDNENSAESHLNLDTKSRNEVIDLAPKPKHHDEQTHNATSRNGQVQNAKKQPDETTHIKTLKELRHYKQESKYYRTERKYINDKPHKLAPNTTNLQPATEERSDIKHKGHVDGDSIEKEGSKHQHNNNYTEKQASPSTTAPHRDSRSEIKHKVHVNGDSTEKEEGNHEKNTNKPKLSETSPVSQSPTRVKEKPAASEEVTAEGNTEKVKLEGHSHDATPRTQNIAAEDEDVAAENNLAENFTFRHVKKSLEPDNARTEDEPATSEDVTSKDITSDDLPRVHVSHGEHLGRATSADNSEDDTLDALTFLPNDPNQARSSVPASSEDDTSKDLKSDDASKDDTAEEISLEENLVLKSSPVKESTFIEAHESQEPDSLAEDVSSEDSSNKKATPHHANSNNLESRTDKSEELTSQEHTSKQFISEDDTMEYDSQKSSSEYEDSHHKPADKNRNGEKSDTSEDNKSADVSDNYAQTTDTFKSAHSHKAVENITSAKLATSQEMSSKGETSEDVTDKHDSEEKHTSKHLTNNEKSAKEEENGRQSDDKDDDENAISKDDISESYLETASEEITSGDITVPNNKVSSTHSKKIQLSASRSRNGDDHTLKNVYDEDVASAEHASKEDTSKQGNKANESVDKTRNGQTSTEISNHVPTVEPSDKTEEGKHEDHHYKPASENRSSKADVTTKDSTSEEVAATDGIAHDTHEPHNINLQHAAKSGKPDSEYVSEDISEQFNDVEHTHNRPNEGRYGKKLILSKSKKFLHNGDLQNNKSRTPSDKPSDFVISQHDSLKKLPYSRDIIEVIQASDEHEPTPLTPHCNPTRRLDSLDDHTHEHKSYRLSFLFNK